MQPPKCETDNCRYRLIRYCRGQGLDIGCHSSRVSINAIGIDLYSPFADMKADARDLQIFPSNHFDFIFSSHLLEEIENTEATLQGWYRLIKNNGYLVLYQADRDFYYPLTDPRCNKSHKHHFLWEDLWEILKKFDGSKLIYHARYGPEPFSEWSFELVVQKSNKDKQEKTLPAEGKTQIRVIMSCFNTGRYVIQCINSIKFQSVKNWVCYIINNASVDKTSNFIKCLTAEDPRFVLIENKEKTSLFQNYQQVLNRPEIDDEDICINLSGSDWLYDEEVFKRILSAYSNEKTLITFSKPVEYNEKTFTVHTGFEYLTDLNDLYPIAFKTKLFRKINNNSNIADTLLFSELLKAASTESAILLNSMDYIYNVAETVR